METNALKQQIGGSHYKDMAFQPIELISRLRCSFIQGCMIKYISRYKNKNSRQDIEKCIHYAQLAKAVGGCWPCDNVSLIVEYCLKNNLGKRQSATIRHIVNCRWLLAEYELREIISEEY